VKILTRAPVLVLEDSNEDFDTIENAYRKAGFVNRLHRAVTGDACLELLQGASPLRPAFLLLDLTTSATDGREALVSIRADPALRQVPVVVLSASTNPRDVDHCYAHGANAYHVKPVRYGEHIQLLVDVFCYWLISAVLPETLNGAS
jgi:CheY-like chemotaxis protein